MRWYEVMKALLCRTGDGLWQKTATNERLCLSKMLNTSFLARIWRKFKGLGILGSGVCMFKLIDDGQFENHLLSL